MSRSHLHSEVCPAKKVGEEINFTASCHADGLPKRLLLLASGPLNRCDTLWLPALFLPFCLVNCTSTGCTRMSRAHCVTSHVKFSVARMRVLRARDANLLRCQVISLCCRLGSLLLWRQHVQVLLCNRTHSLVSHVDVVFGHFLMEENWF